MSHAWAGGSPCTSPTRPGAGPGLQVDVPGAGHVLGPGHAVPCRVVPAAGRRVRCGGGSPGDLKCLVLPGDVLAASRHQVNTGDAVQPRGARPDPAANRQLPRPSPAFRTAPALPCPCSRERGHVPAGKGTAGTPRVSNSCSCIPRVGTTAVHGACACSRGQPHRRRPGSSSRRPGHPPALTEPF